VVVPRQAAATDDARPSAASTGGSGLREKARQVLEQEASRRGLPSGSVTDEHVSKFLSNPRNRALLEGMK
jgi:hypothetical protein